MTIITYNEDNLNSNDINNYIKRAKLIIENSKNELLVVLSNQNYFLLGGHVENNETDRECLLRELKEETGTYLPFPEQKPFFTINYYCKDYPKNNINTMYINNYYHIKYDLVPDSANTNLTCDEKKGNFTIKFIPKNQIIDVLKENLKVCTKPLVVRDTIDVIKKYLEL